MADFDWDKPKETNIPDWDKQGPGKSIAKRPGGPTFPQQMYGLAYGVGTELAGAPGEIQEFFTTSGKGEKLFGPESPVSLPNLPTAGQIRKELKGTPLEPTRGTKAMQQTGQVLTDIGMALPAGYRGMGKFVGDTTKEAERVAGIAERLGFKLSPSQVRAESPVAEKGALFASKENQLLANRLASNGTGKAVDEITEPFLRSRIKDLGREFDNVYKGKTFNIDPAISTQLENLIAQEQQLGFAGVPAVRSAADSILNNIGSGTVKGDDLQRLRNALTQAARTTDSRGKAHEIYELVDVLDTAVETRNPGLKAKLDVIRPQYRNTVILEDLLRSGGIDNGNISLERLGNQLADKAMLRRNPQDIDNLGMLGRQLRLRARWETAGEEAPGIVKEVTRTHGTLPTVIKRTLGAPLRSTVARKAQVAAQRGSAPRKLLEAIGTVPGIEEIIGPRE